MLAAHRTMKKKREQIMIYPLVKGWAAKHLKYSYQVKGTLRTGQDQFSVKTNVFIIEKVTLRQN